MRKLSILLCLILPFWASASTIKGKMEGAPVVIWENARELQSNYYSPTWWTASHMLQPTESWVAGGLHTTPPSILVLGNGTDQVNAKFSLVGLQYQITEAGLSETPESGLHCVFGYRAGTVLSLVGSAGCQYDKRFNYTGTVTPYSFTRPIFQIDEADLYAQLVGKSAGVYRGVVLMSSFFDYFSQSGARARYVDNQQMFVEIDYNPAYITRIVVTPNNEQDFILRYDRLNNELSGQTRFQVIVDGNFTRGLTISLESGRTKYMMQESGGSEFAYSIHCNGCRDIPLVNQGVPSVSSTVITSGVTTQLSLELEVFFDHVALDDLVDALYSDSFYLFFEPTI